MPSTSRTVWRGRDEAGVAADAGGERDERSRGRVTVERVDRNEVLRLLDEADAQLVDVRSAEQDGRAHLPGATNLPLVHVVEGVDQLDPTRPVIVYCSDARSDTSARAAARLGGLGFRPVYRYASGSADWRAAGLTVEGREGALGRAGTVARRDAPAARSGEAVGDVADGGGADRTEPVVVVDDDGGVLGLLPGAALANRTAVVGGRLEDLPAPLRAAGPRDELAA